jgi:hypothetical protein
MDIALIGNSLQAIGEVLILCAIGVLLAVFPRAKKTSDETVSPESVGSTEVQSPVPSKENQILSRANSTIFTKV